MIHPARNQDHFMAGADQTARQSPPDKTGSAGDDNAGRTHIRCHEDATLRQGVHATLAGGMLRLERQRHAGRAGVIEHLA